MSNISKNSDLKEKLLEPFVEIFSGGEIWLFAGSPPEDTDEFVNWNTSDYIGYIELPSVPFEKSGSGTFVQKGEWEGFIDWVSGGTHPPVGWFRMLDSTYDNYWLDGTVSLPGEGGTLQMPNLVLPSNATVRVTSAEFIFE